MMLEIDDIFDEKYRIVSILGRGGMSVVYKAQNMALGNYWAIKQVYKTLKGREIDYLAEPNILKTLSHPMLPRIIDIKEDDESFFVVMDFIDGADLDTLVKRHHRFPEEQVLEWAKQICGVLDYLHTQKKPIIYRDMKPGNLMLTNDGQIKIIDFGIARQYKEESTTDTTVMGTRGYAAPEQYGQNQSDARTDIYSLGITLYHLLTGISPNEPPYEVRALREIDRSFSMGMEYIVGKCTQNDPAQRYQTAKELLKDLENIYCLDQDYKKLQKKKNVLFTLFIALYLVYAGMGYYGWLTLDSARYQSYLACFQNASDFIDARKFTESKVEIAKAVEMFPQDLDGYVAEAKWYYAQQRYEECISFIDANIYNHSFSADSYSAEKFAEVPYLKALCYSGLDNYAFAEVYYEESVRHAPSNAQYFIDYAMAASKNDHPEKADSALNIAKTLGADEGSLQLIKAQMYTQTEELQQAEKILLQLTKNVENAKISQQAYMELSKLYEQQGQTAEAIALLEQGLTLPHLQDNPQLMESLAYLCTQEGMESDNFSSYRQALPYYEKLLEQGYTRYYLLDNMAVVYQNIGQLAKAKEVMLQARELYPQDYRPFIRLVSILNQEMDTIDLLDRDYQELKSQYDQGMKLYQLYSAAVGKEDPDVYKATDIVEELTNKGWLQ